MHNEVSNWISQIFAQYQPLSNLDRQLIGPSTKDDFKKFVFQFIAPLSEPIRQRIIDELFDWGPLTRLKNREDIFDIIVQDYNSIYYETNKGFQVHNEQFISLKTYKNFLDRLSTQAEFLINQKDPFANGQLEGFRIHLVIPPIVKKPVLTLRKHRKNILALSQLLETDFLSIKEKHWCQKIIHEKKNFLIVGPTGSGKTTFLNALLAEITVPQRNVIIEDTDEINNSNPLTCKLISREICPETLTPINMSDLVKQSLRMRPDRIIIGEVRGSEAKDLLQALATGHSGSIGTLHASSGQQALLRLEMLIQMGAPHWSLHSIRQLIQMSLDYLIVLKEDRLQKGIKEICKISSLESFGLLLENLKINEVQSADGTLRPINRFI